MSWDFVWGMLIGSCIGLLFAGLSSTEHGDRKHIESDKQESDEDEE